MSTAELKSNLHRLIDSVQDSKMLKITYLLLSKTEEGNKDWWDTISAKEKAAIEEGLKDIKKGNVFSHDKVMQEIRAEFPGILK
jgi:predicted transcriptional regulator